MLILEKTSVNSSYQTKVPFLRHILLGLTCLYTFLIFMPIKMLLISIVLTALVAFGFIYLIVPGRKIHLDQLTAEVYIFFIFWIIWSLAGIFWAQDQIAVLSAIPNQVIYLFIFVLISQVLSSYERQQKMVIFFQAIFLIYNIVFLWELLTRNHLPGSRFYGTKIPIPTGPFFNENNTASLCLLLIPFLTVSSPLNKKKGFKGLMIAAVIFFLAITIIQSARITVILLLLYLVLYGIFKASWFSRLVTAGILIVVVLLFVNLYPKIAKIAQSYINYQYESLLQENSDIKMTSLKVREALMKEGFDIAAGSYFLGVGGGNFEDRIMSGRYHNTSWILNAHNFWIENLANYGILIFLGLLYFYFRWLYRIGNLTYKAVNHENRQFYSACFLSMLFFIPLTFIPSSLRWFFPAWFYLAVMNAVSSNPLTFSKTKNYISR